jgi:putative transposase
MVQPSFTHEHMRYAYSLRYHLGFQTHHREALFSDSSFRDLVKAELEAVCVQSSFHLLESEIVANSVRLLLSLRPEHSPAKTAQTIKANLSRRLLESCASLGGRKRGALWARGYFARSVGDVTHDVVLGYVQGQADHHLETNTAHLLAEYNHPDPEQFTELRPRAHCMAQYNCHLVCTPIGRHAALDQRIANKLVSYLLEVATARDFVILSLAVLSNHLHLFAALSPSASPEALALAVMNNTSYWLYRNNPGLFRAFEMPGYWTSSAYLGTAGAATTNQVRGYLRSTRS